MVYKLQKNNNLYIYIYIQILYKVLTQFSMFYVHLFKLYIFFIFL